MGERLEISKRVPTYSKDIYSDKEAYSQEYSNPCPLLTPDNLGYPRPSPYTYIHY